MAEWGFLYPHRSEGSYQHFDRLNVSWTTSALDADNALFLILNLQNSTTPDSVFTALNISVTSQSKWSLQSLNFEGVTYNQGEFELQYYDKHGSILTNVNSVTFNILPENDRGSTCRNCIDSSGTSSSSEPGSAPTASSIPTQSIAPASSTSTSPSTPIQSTTPAGPSGLSTVDIAGLVAAVVVAALLIIGGFIIWRLRRRRAKRRSSSVILIPPVEAASGQRDSLSKPLSPQLRQSSLREMAATPIRRDPPAYQTIDRMAANSWAATRLSTSSCP